MRPFTGFCQWSAVALCVAVSMMLAGCGKKGPELVPVEGQVLLDGKPLAGATVMFYPEQGGRPATGTTDEQGRFTLTTLEAGDGAHVGVNKVAVVKEGENPAAANVEEGEIVPVVYETPVKYASPDTSGIVIEVKPGMEPVTIELSSGQ